jgi:hypothetical protein
MSLPFPEAIFPKQKHYLPKLVPICCCCNYKSVDDDGNDNFDEDRGRMDGGKQPNGSGVETLKLMMRKWGGKEREGEMAEAERRGAGGRAKIHPKSSQNEEEATFFSDVQIGLLPFPRTK